MPQGRRGEIVVLAGTNGGGKSSVGGHHLRAVGDTYYNPDEIARRIREIRPELSQRDANAQAWERGVVELRKAIENHSDFAFETTLGGNTVPGLIEEAADRGLDVHMWYVGLASADLHVQRVRERATRGGHDIPEAKIRQRYDASRSNLVRLLPKLASLSVYDNSAPPDPETAEVEPMLVLRMEARRIVERVPPDEVPEWAREIMRTAEETDRRARTASAS
jgi:predicted ABC-type ATPase